MGGISTAQHFHDMDEQVGLPPVAVPPAPKPSRLKALPDLPSPPVPKVSTVYADKPYSIKPLSSGSPHQGLSGTQKSILAWDAALTHKKFELDQHEETLHRQEALLQQQEGILRHREEQLHNQVKKNLSQFKTAEQLQAAEILLRQDIEQKQEEYDKLQKSVTSLAERSVAEQAALERKKVLMSDLAQKMVLEKKKMEAEFRKLEADRRFLQEQQDTIRSRETKLYQEKQALEQREASLKKKAEGEAAALKQKVTKDLHGAMMAKDAIDKEIGELQLKKIEFAKKLSDLTSTITTAQSDARAKEQELAAFHRSVSTKEALLEVRHSDLHALEQKLTGLEASLAEREKSFSGLVSKTKAMLKEKEQLLEQREAEISQREGAAAEREKQVLGPSSKVKERLEGDAKRLDEEIQRKRAAFEKEMADKKAALRSEIMASEQSLLQVQEELKFASLPPPPILQPLTGLPSSLPPGELHDEVAGLEAQRHEIEQEIMTLQNQLTLLRRDASDAEQQKAAVLADLDKSHQQKSKQLHAELDDKLLIKKASIADLDKQHEAQAQKLKAKLQEERNKALQMKENDHLSFLKAKQQHELRLRQAEQQLQQKEEELLETIKLLESDEKLLRAKEDELVSNIKRFESDRKSLDDKEMELLGVIKKLDEKEALLQKDLFKIREYEAIKEDLRKVKDELVQKKTLLHEYARQVSTITEKKAKAVELQKLQADISSLEQARSSIRQEMGVERERLEEEIKVLSANAKELSLVKEMARGISEREAVITKKEEILNGLHESIIASLDSSATASSSMVGLDGQKRVIQQLMDAEDDVHLDVYAMMAKARQALAYSNIAEAQSIYRSIQRSYRTLDADNEEKKRVYCDVMELKTDIELEGLG